jgi:hypothetical protein
VIKIQLNDPGMHNKYVTAATEADVQKVLLEHNTTYTLAFVTDKKANTLSVYDRDLGDREWQHRMTRQQSSST